MSLMVTLEIPHPQVDIFALPIEHPLSAATLCHGLYDSGRSIQDITKTLEIDTPTVCEQLGIERWCEECGRQSDGHTIDFGIGSYEFWGMCDVDIQLAYVSRCCEATLLDENGNEILDDPGPDYYKDGE